MLPGVLPGVSELPETGVPGEGASDGDCVVGVWELPDDGYCAATAVGAPA